MTVPEALRAMLRATAPSEASLPEAERLAAVKPGATAVWLKGRPWNETDAAMEALSRMLTATDMRYGPLNKARFRVLAEARVAAQAALDKMEPEPSPFPCGMTVDQFVTAKQFREHEYRVAAGYDAALAVEPGLTCAEWEQRNPFGGVAS